MDTEQQKALVRRYYDEMWSRGDFALLEQHFATSYVNCDPATPGRRIEGRVAMRDFVTGFRTAIPDLQMKIDRQVADGDTVVSHWFGEGTHRGPLFGAPATGRAARVEGITMTRFEGSMIVEDVAVWDALGLLRQLGLVPA